MRREGRIIVTLHFQEVTLVIAQLSNRKTRQLIRLSRVNVLPKMGPICHNQLIQAEATANFHNKTDQMGAVPSERVPGASLFVFEVYRACKHNTHL